jgi:hypothetical protein
VLIYYACHRLFQSCCTSFWRPALADSRGDATDVNEQTKSGMTPLMCAVKVLGPKNGDDGIVAFLLENKANVNLQDVMGDTVLHIACCSKVLHSLSPFPPFSFSLFLSLSLSRSRSRSLSLSLSLCVPACPGVFVSVIQSDCLFLSLISSLLPILAEIQKFHMHFRIH